MSEILEIIDAKIFCVWKSKEVCKIPDDKSCPSDCSLKDLAWDKDKIIERIKSEDANIHKFKREGMFKNREKIKDTIAGMYILERCLKKNFDYTPIHVVDKDFERGLPSKGWRK